MRLKLITVLLTMIVINQCWATESEIKLCLHDTRNNSAVEYCGTRPSGGRCQFEMLIMEGLQQNNYVLEIGHGTLMSAIPIMSFLEKGHYVGIDPNKWVMEASLRIEENFEVVCEREPIFLSNTDFDASSLGITFDYVFAHSIMSHAAHWQLPLFLSHCAKVLKEGGKLVFSIRLTEGNEYGSQGAEQETHAEEWQYPGCSFFQKETVVKEASKWFSKIEQKIEYTELLTKDSYTVCHDWFVLTK